VEVETGREGNQAVLKQEGTLDSGEQLEVQTDLLWRHAVSKSWNSQIGLRYQGGAESSRSWLSAGLQGATANDIEVEVMGYVGEQGRTALGMEAEMEFQLMPKVTLEPHIEATFYGKSDEAREMGSGLSEVKASLRLLVEIHKQVAPYLGVERIGKFGGTADMARDAGEQTYETRIIGGLHITF